MVNQTQNEDHSDSSGEIEISETDYIALHYERTPERHVKHITSSTYDNVWRTDNQNWARAPSSEREIADIDTATDTTTADTQD